MNALLHAGWAPAAVFCYGMLVAGALGLYARYPWLDSAMHFLGGVALAYFFSRFSGALVSIALVLATALLWELGETAWDAWQATQTSKGSADTALDLAFGLAGAALFLVGTALGARRAKETRHERREAGGRKASDQAQAGA